MKYPGTGGTEGGSCKMLEEKVPEELELHISDPEEQEPEEKENGELVLTPSVEEKKGEELMLTPSREEEGTAEELTLTPSPEEKTASEELTLEADRIYKASEITFDGEEESEERVEKAMEEYDAAMDAAAGKSN
jgi:hypothetical protein